ncbi:MAG: flagellar hook-length control protein FliK [Leptospirillia bacterium]
MGILTVSHPVGEIPARPDHSQETRSVTKKARKSTKDSSPVHAGKRGISESKESSPRSFASIYRKSLDPAQKASGEETPRPSSEKSKGHPSPHPASLATRSDRPRKKKTRPGGDDSPVLPLVIPDDVSEKPARQAPDSGKVKPRVLWGPQGEGSLANAKTPKPEPGGPSPAKTLPAPSSLMAGTPGVPLPKKEEGEGTSSSGTPREASPSGEFANVLGAAALAGEAKGSKPSGISRREGLSQDFRLRPVKGEFLRKGGPDSESLPLTEVSSKPSGGPTAALSPGSASDVTGKRISKEESGSKGGLPDSAEILAAAETSGGSSSVASPSEGGGGSPSAIASEIPGRVSSMAAGGGGQVSLEVKPPHLGPVGVRVHVDSSTRQVRVELSSHDPRIRHLLAGKEGEIKESLSERGFVLDRFVVGSQGQSGVGLSDVAGGLAGSGQTSGSGGDSGTSRQDPQGSGSGSGSGGAMTSDPGGFSRQGASQSGSFGRDSGGGRDADSGRGTGASVPLEEMALSPPALSGSSPPSGYHRIA